MKLTIRLLVILTIIGASSCGPQKFSLVQVYMNGLIPETIELKSSAVSSEYYQNLTRGVNLVVVSNFKQTDIIDNSELPSSWRNSLSKQEPIITPQLKSFVENSLTTYMRRMGIKVNSNTKSDYRLRVTVEEFKFVRQMNSSRATVVIAYTLNDNNNEPIFSKIARGRISDSGGAVADALDKAYEKALTDMDWQEIADALTTHNRPDQEGQRQVTGEGNTSLEHTVIRWFIDSSPKGADVTWRVISSTPDVKNTNSTYVGTTPYETTETFDIRGLKLENSGNVQIEVMCEKPGYLPQKRRFNLRQAIEQREISAKFNLVKEDE